MELTVYRDRVPIGTAAVTEDGARLRVQFRTAFQPGIHRLYLMGDGEPLPAGVLLPEGGELTLDRAVAKQKHAAYTCGVLCTGDARPTAADLPAPRDRWLETDRPESFPSDEILKQSLTGTAGVLYRYRTGRVELAVPVDAQAHIAPALILTRAETLRGGNYFVLTLTPAGLPCPSEPASID